MSSWPEKAVTIENMAMVELEEIALGGLFIKDNKVIEIREEHFAKLPELLPSLSPIPISAQRLWKLGFDRFITTGVCYRDAQDVRLFLKPATLKRWIVQFDGVPKAGFVEYIHQVQRLWFNLFQEHLSITQSQNKAQLAGSKAGSTFRQPSRVTSTVKDGVYSVVLQRVEDQPYYLTNDSRLLIRSGAWAIWRVEAKNPLFTINGKPWGLTLLAGRVTETERIKAGKWLQNNLIHK